jgi:hypothetical protein
LIDYDILERLGSTEERIREVATAKEGTDDYKHRQRLQNIVRSRAYSGLLQNFGTYPAYYAAGLAWDGPVVNKEVLPLLQYAQGKIDFKEIHELVEKLPTSTQNKICDRDDKGELIGLNLPEFLKVSVNYVKSLVTRRQAALTSKVLQQVPFMKFDVDSGSYVAQLRGDATSQKVEQIVNAYDMRHDYDQVVRDALLYGFAVEFPVQAWSTDYQLRKKAQPEGADPNDFEMEAVLEREGLLMHRPHVTRVSHDPLFPLSTVNTDTGVEWVQYWDLVRYRDVERNPAFWNRDAVKYSSQFIDLFALHADYFKWFFSDTCRFPSKFGVGIGMNNDRLNFGYYNSDTLDDHVMVTKHRMKIIPAEWGLGKYPYPVWLSLTIAGDDTIVHGQFLPSTPAVYYGINQADNRKQNTGFAHECIPWQDALQNTLNQILLNQNASLITLIGVNSDVVPAKQIEGIKRMIESGTYAKPGMFTFSAAELQETGLSSKALTVDTTNIQHTRELFFSLFQLFAAAERILNVTPAEVGQPIQREASATEVHQMSMTTDAVHEFMERGCLEGLVAKKKMIYESMIALGSSQIRVSVVNRYNPETIQKAGFRIDLDDEGGDTPSNLQTNQRLTVIGSKQALRYHYTFTSREGSNRMSGARSAEIMVNSLQIMSNIEGLMQSLGKGQLYDYINAINRALGVPVNVTFTLAEGEDPNLPVGDPKDKEQIRQAFTQIGTAVQQQGQKLAQLEAVLAQLAQSGAPNAVTAPSAEGVPPEVAAEMAAQV